MDRFDEKIIGYESTKKHSTSNTGCPEKARTL